MAKVTLVRTSQGIETALEQMVERGDKLASFLQNHTFPQYRNFQAQRWATQGSSEGATWNSLNPTYALSKPKLIGTTLRPKRSKKMSISAKNSPKNNMTESGLKAAGLSMMVLTGRLVDAAFGPNAQKVITQSGITVTIDGTALPYAKYASAIRPVMKFSDSSQQTMVDDVIRYLMRGDS